MPTSVLEEKVRYCEVDQMGIAHHSNYISWFELGRIDYLDRAGLDYAEMEKEGYRLVVMGLSVKYRKPLRFSEKLSIHTTAERVSVLKVLFSYEIKNDAGELCCTGETLLGSIDPEGKPFPLNNHIIDSIKKGYP